MHTYYIYLLLISLERLLHWHGVCLFWLVRWLIGWLNYLLMDGWVWLVAWLIAWLVAWLFGWRITHIFDTHRLFYDLTWPKRELWRTNLSIVTLKEETNATTHHTMLGVQDDKKYTSSARNNMKHIFQCKRAICYVKTFFTDKTQKRMIRYTIACINYLCKL